VDRLGIFRPLQLFLARLEMFQDILEPQQIAIALAHCFACLSTSLALAGTGGCGMQGACRGDVRLGSFGCKLLFDSDLW
jgi:hypothetical protein